MFCTDRFRVIATVEESKQLTASQAPAIVISSSGMAEGGRVLHHLKAALPNARNTVLFAGYQAAGTRGRRLVDGEKTVKIHGEWVPVAARIERHRLDVGARRLDRDPALAARLYDRAQGDVHRARRGHGHAGRCRRVSTGSSAGHIACPSTARRWH